MPMRLSVGLSPSWGCPTTVRSVPTPNWSWSWIKRLFRVTWKAFGSRSGRCAHLHRGNPRGTGRQLGSSSAAAAARPAAAAGAIPR